MSDKTAWEGRDQQLGARIGTVWSLSRALGPAKENNYALGSLDGYIVRGCWELKRKFRFKVKAKAGSAATTAATGGLRCFILQGLGQDIIAKISGTGELLRSHALTQNPFSISDWLVLAREFLNNLLKSLDLIQAQLLCFVHAGRQSSACHPLQAHVLLENAIYIIILYSHATLALLVSGFPTYGIPVCWPILHPSLGCDCAVLGSHALQSGDRVNGRDGRS